MLLITMAYEKFITTEKVKYAFLEAAVAYIKNW